MLAAPLETLVPVIPIAMPMSACLSTGASLTPPAVIATTWPLVAARLQRLDDTQLVFGRDAGHYPEVRCAAAQLAAERAMPDSQLTLSSEECVLSSAATEVSGPGTPENPMRCPNPADG
jgi:hypothetical protein